MIARVNESIIHIKSRTTINVDVEEKIQESIMFVKKIILESWYMYCENSNYLGNIIDDSVMMI